MATVEEVRALKEQLQRLIEAQENHEARNQLPINETFTPQYQYYEPPRLAEMNSKINAMTIGNSEPAVEIPTGSGNLMNNAKVNPKEQCMAIGVKSEVTSEGSHGSREMERGELSWRVHEEATVTIPFPQRHKKERMKERLSKFLEIFKKVNINIPLVEMLLEMPQYAKFLKDIVSRKKKLGEFETLAIGELKPTSIRIQMADRSVTYPRGIVENLLVKVGDFILPADFVVLDIEDDNKIPLILGRELTLRVHDESQTFYVYEPYRIHKDEVPKKAKDPGTDPGDRKLKGGILAGKSGAWNSCSQHCLYQPP
ncbi:uncharacterized protein LOC131019037 [Salvia miltiorrhiza]|uniref:uncharacterized protein LOC131019037 n=1 Tax=Salvia miltiorrhiza TaxID=226208 RepID=UPI0025AD148E|nr:uncharacterized protein LOC131019037 [Salvia miltiorrhiza]